MAFQSSSDETSGVLSEINVTPLVDVMLVLLIIFMVAAPLIQQQVDVDLPQTQSQQSVSVKENDIVLILDSQKNIFIQNVAVPMNELEEKLKAMYKSKTSKEIFLQADQSLPYGFIVQVMALVKNAGISKMGMVTDAPDQS